MRRDDSVSSVIKRLKGVESYLASMIEDYLPSEDSPRAYRETLKARRGVSQAIEALETALRICNPKKKERFQFKRDERPAF